VARKPADQSVSRDEIIHAAADILRQNGYEATTMKDIAARVDLTAASLYHHFRSKDFLLLAVLEIGLDHAISEIEPLLTQTLTCTEKLRRMIRAHIVNVTANTAVGAAMVFEIKSLMTVRLGGRGSSDDGDKHAEFIERRQAFFRQRDRFEQLFREVVEQGIRNGEFRQVDAAIFAKAMLGAHNWVGVWFRDEGRLSGEQIADIMADTFLTSLEAKK